MPSALRVSKDQQVVIVSAHELSQVIDFQIVDDFTLFTEWEI